MAASADEPTRRRQRSDGERSRRAILEAATALATVEGLEGLSIARLAEHAGMSKSGLYAHFRSKEELQLATIEAAEEIFASEVTGPGSAHAAGLERVYGLCDAFLSYVERRVFPGGCFFASAAAELDTREGRVRDRIRAAYAGWLDLLGGAVEDARRLGQLGDRVDVDQLVFELDSLLLGANAGFVLFDDARAPERARAGVRDRIGRAAAAAGSRGAG
jgi:AcrR family transcriptional regulator